MAKQRDLTRFYWSDVTQMEQAIAAGEIAGAAGWLTEAGDLRTLPSHLDGRGGLDGFYAARLTRRG